MERITMGNVKVRKVISYILAPAEYRTWTMISQFKPKDINLKTYGILTWFEKEQSHKGWRNELEMEKSDEQGGSDGCSLIFKSIEMENWPKKKNVRRYSWNCNWFLSWPKDGAKPQRMEKWAGDGKVRWARRLWWMFPNLKVHWNGNWK